MAPADGARLLSQALAQETDGEWRAQLAVHLALAAGRLEPDEAAPFYLEAARAQVPALDRGADDAARRSAAERLALLLKPLDSTAANHAARVIVRRIVADPSLYYFADPDPMDMDAKPPRVFHPDVLEQFLTHAPRTLVRQQSAATASVVGTLTGGSLASLAFLRTAGEPLPSRLSTQDLVELLKMPTCVSEVRRIVLDQLGNRFGRRFETHWDFVRYAQEQGLNLDVTTPPKRPQAKLPALFE
jgi:hypothetical protein